MKIRVVSPLFGFSELERMAIKSPGVLEVIFGSRWQHMALRTPVDESDPGPETDATLYMSSHGKSPLAPGSHPADTVQHPHPFGHVDRIYWRPSGAPSLWHCLKHDANGYVTLCGDRQVPGPGGQACCRPPLIRRCALCDVREIDRRGREESLPASPNWKTALLDIEKNE